MAAGRPVPERRMTRSARLAAIPAVFTIGLVLVPTSAAAEVKKFMQICDGQRLCPFYRLALTPPKDWVVEEAASKQYNMQMLVPRGLTFGNAPAVIYVKVSLRDKDQSLDEFVRVSQERWRRSVRDTKIDKQPDIERANGQPAYLSFRYVNPSRPQQAFEAVSFAHDKDSDGNEFTLMVVVTGSKKDAIDKAMTPYQAFLKAH
jgi:hypothetical protein